MAYQSMYRTGYRRHRRRRRNSHWGVLIAMILVVVIAVPVVFRMVKGLAGAVTGGFGGGNDNQIVFQMDNNMALLGGDLIDAGGTPFRDTSGNAFVPVKALCDHLGFTFEQDASGNTITVKDKKLTLTAKVNSTTMQVNEESVSLSGAPSLKDGAVFVPADSFGQAMSLKVNDLGAAQNDLIVLTKTKKEIKPEKLDETASAAVAVLGPSLKQLEQSSVLMRVGSDKLAYGGASARMVQEGETLGTAAVEQDGQRFVPLLASVSALGGTAASDGSSYQIRFDGIESAVDNSAKATIGGQRVKGKDFAAFTDEKGHFYVSAPLFATLIGRNYTDLGDGEGSFAFTKGALDGCESKKTYLDTMTNGLTGAVGGDIPEADVYVALTFDDGPTGRTDTYSSGYTATLLDELKKRGVHATFFMCGYRIKDFHDHMERYLAEGHELGNHTMDHPDSRLTHMDAASVREQVESNDDLIESYTGQRTTVMRPVGGGVNDTVKEQMKALGLPIINWSVDTLDWQTRNDPDSVKNHIVSKVQDGDIVLMHDIWQGTLPGVLAAIDELQSRTDQTYAFVTVSELAAVKGISLEPGVVYSDLSDSTVQAIQDGTYVERIFD